MQGGFTEDRSEKREKRNPQTTCLIRLGLNTTGILSKECLARKGGKPEGDRWARKEKKTKGSGHICRVLLLPAIFLFNRRYRLQGLSRKGVRREFKKKNAGKGIDFVGESTMHRLTIYNDLKLGKKTSLEKEDWLENRRVKKSPGQPGRLGVSWF